MKVGIIGAGPRGILLTSQLFNQYKYRSDQSEELEITLFDPYGIGGRVWQTDQWTGLLMNTPADQITLFTDESVNMTGEVYDGPSLFEWAASSEAHNYLTTNQYSQDLIEAAAKLGGSDYAPRPLYGAYIKWFYQELINQQPTQCHVDLVEDEVVELTEASTNQVSIKTADKDYSFNKVVMSLGQQDNYLNQEEQKLATYAQDNNLTYLAPTHPGDADLSNIPSSETVIIRGLGLSFNDYVSELTLGRGGSYMINDDGSLSYQPSGREPRIVAGSRRGIPYYPKAVSEKGYGELAPAYFLTDERMDAASVDGYLPFDKFIELLRSDMELVYYSLLINDRYPNKNATEFKQRFIKTDDRKSLLDQYQFAEEDILDWDYILNPFKDVKVIGTEDYQGILVNWLDNVTKDANQGSKTGPVGSALELLRDYRPIFRKIIADHRFSNDDYVNKFLRSFSSDNSFLSVGAPSLRSEQLSALIRSGLVRLLAPGMEVKGDNGWFVTAAPRRNADKFKASALLEARVPKANLDITANPLLESLVNNQLARTMKINVNGQDVGVSAVDVDESTDQLRNKAGFAQPRIYIWGVPLEGLRFTTNASPRPGVNDTSLQTADLIAAEVLGLKTAQDVDVN